jgi:hypothetical protein
LEETDFETREKTYCDYRNEFLESRLINKYGDDIKKKPYEIENVEKK